MVGISWLGASFKATAHFETELHPVHSLIYFRNTRLNTEAISLCYVFICHRAAQVILSHADAEIGYIDGRLSLSVRITERCQPLRRLTHTLRQVKIMKP